MKICSVRGTKIRLKVKLTSTLKTLVGRGELDVECQENTTMAELQDILVRKFGSKIIGKTPEYYWLHHRADYIVIVLNETVIEPENMHHTRLQDGDVVTFLPAVSGG